MKIYLDDVRNPPDESWSLARSYDDFVKLVLSGEDITHMSLDHDLGMVGEIEAPSGLKAAKFFIDECMNNPTLADHLVEIKVHSYNPVGAENILSFLQAAQRYDIISKDIVLRKI